MRREGKVTYKDEVIGVLEEIPYGGTSFNYDDKWVKEAIACAFPINQRRFEWQNGLHPFFQNLLPEGWLREGQAKAANIRDNKDDFGILLRFGKDCIGAIGVINSSEVSTMTQQGDEMSSSINAHKTISGVQKKLLAYKENNKFHASIDGKSATHIAKFNTERLPDLVRNERQSLTLAQHILGNDKVTNFSLSSVCGEVALLVERFDRKDFTKLRMEEFAQILCRISNEKYNGSYEEIGNAILNYSALPQVDLELYFKQIIFSIIIGNCDAHLKNFALIETNIGLRLSPAYDLVNTLIYNEKFDRKIALSLLGEKISCEQINRKILIEFGEKIGLQTRAITIALDELRKCFKGKKAQNVLKPPDVLEGSDRFLSRYKEIVDAACIRILIE